ncbi:CatB-related O-acetyltransferase [uncultured Massilia sp.]|uniref:CatB-related O-acetyltransferase n=1 Tax=uncultured Massilia sp. TaxID=169973 RepID=UPI0025866DAD|nr:CatB-related O-acetyltransferase [uncultured Massilia sp.]
MTDPATFLNCSAPPEVVISYESPVHLDGVSISSSTSIGAYSYFGQGCRIGTLERIGRFCSVAPDVTIGLGNHPTDYLSTHPLFFRSAAMFAPWNPPEMGVARTQDVIKHSPSIGNDVWIGTRAVIARGVTIGDGAIVGAGSLVLQDVPPYAIVAGTPAKVLRYRFPQEQVAALLALQWWNYPLEIMRGLPVDDMDACLPLLRERIARSSPLAYDIYTIQGG